MKVLVDNRSQIVTGTILSSIEYLELQLSGFVWSLGITHFEDPLEGNELHQFITYYEPNQVYICSEKPSTIFYVAQHLNCRWIIPHPQLPLDYELVTPKTLREKSGLEYDKVYEYLRLRASGLSEKWSKQVLKEYNNIYHFIERSHEVSDRKLIKKHLNEHPELWIQ